MLKKIIREPLFHFLILGAGIFLLFGAGNDSRSQGSDKIVITAGQLEQLVVGFTRTWQRPPSQQELQGLIEDSIREEVLYREAMAMGLDRDDTIVRRRMRQKLEFLTEDLASTALPTDEELQAYLDQHADQYRQEPQLSFEQIFFNRERRGKSAEADARALLTQLNGKGRSAVDLNSAGDASLLPIEFSLASQGEVARLFGEEFAQQMADADTGRWVGPVESSYGLHLVFVRERVPGRLPALSEVKDAVQRDLLRDRRRQALDTAYAQLRKRYTVVVEPPQVEVGSAGKTEGQQ